MISNRKREREAERAPGYDNLTIYQIYNRPLLIYNSPSAAHLVLKFHFQTNKIFLDSLSTKP